MHSIRIKKEHKPPLYTLTVFLVLTAGVVLLSRAAIQSYREARESRGRHDIALREAEQARDRLAALRESLGRLETPEGFEEEVRERFNVGRPGEGLVVVLEEEPRTEGIPVERSAWRKFLNWIGIR